MVNPSLSTLMDPFTASSINTTLWNNITAGTATLDTTNDLIVLQQPTVSGTNNTFGSTNLYDATGASIYAQITPVPTGNGQTKTTFKLQVDANNSVQLRLVSGVFIFMMQTAGVSTNTTLASYDPNAHRWWRLRESGGVWYGDASPDGLNWTNLVSSSYSWSPSAMQFQFITGAGATEVAGNVATIGNVNSTSGGSANPNWPLTAVGWGARWSANSGGVPLDRYVDVSRRTRDGISVGRGRQYELDQPQAGTLDVTLANTDAALDPTNSSGPYAGHIAPYQPMRVRAQWPPTRNLLTQVQATAGDLGGTAGTIDTSVNGPSIFTQTDSSHGSFVASASAWQGGMVMQFAVATSATAGSLVVYTPQVDVEPGAQYAQTIQARNVTASSSVQVAAVAQWRDASQNLISTSTGSTATLAGAATAWTSLSVSGTAPATAAFMYVGVAVVSAPTANCNIQVDGWQFERASAASSWCCPGTWHPIYGGFSERWPSEWILSGTYGRVHPTGVDALALLSQIQLADPFIEEIMSYSPRFLFTLGDPSGSTTFTDATGTYPAAPAAALKTGAGTITPGASITSVSTTGGYIGSSNSVTTITNPSPGNTSTNVPASYVNLAAAGIVGPASQAWSRSIAFRYQGSSSLLELLWGSMDNLHGGAQSGILQVILAGTYVQCTIAPQGVGTGFGFSVPGTINDGNWHHLVFGYDSVGGNMRICLDGSSTTVNIGGGLMPTTLLSDSIGAFVDPLLNVAYYSFSGDVAFACEWPSLLSAATCTSLYNSWKSASTGESSGARYSRILRYINFGGVSSVQTGQTTSMGPATDIAGTDALSALQAVVETENGEHYVARDGTLTFKGRGARYNALTPVYTFGENTASGEWPYEEVTFDLDPTRLANTVTTTQTSSGQEFVAQDSASQAAYFPRTMTRSINSTSTGECQDAADYLLSRYKQPATRVSGITLHPSAMPAMWPVALSLELGMRVRVMRRPPGVPASQVECFIEQINWSLDDQGEATVTLMCSPADLTPYGVFASFHTTLNASISAGVTSIVIKAGADNTNPCAAQVGDGQQLVLGQGTANQETVTIANGGVGATSSGWTTCTIQLTAATTKAHSANDVICEPLPSGTTDPTMWDSIAKFDSVAFAY